MAISIVRAGPTDARRLTQIAHAAKSYWGYPARWIEIWRNQLTVTAAYITEHEVYKAVDEDEVILGFFALSQTEGCCSLEHLWVQPVSLGAGVGTLLFEFAVERATQLGASTIEIESDPNAEGFYRKMGAEVVGEVTYALQGQERRLPFLVYVIGARPDIPHFEP